MSVILFDFTDPAHSQQFTMGKTTYNGSVNPANVSGHCIYAIYNQNHNPRSIYIGYAQNANHRWNTRTEVFHCFGISHAYAKAVKCAWCHPKYSNNNNADPYNNAHWNLMNAQYLPGMDAAEHLLIRMAVNGVMGPITNTNTMMANSTFDRRVNFHGLTRAYVMFGTKFNFPNAVGNNRYTDINTNFY